jgi:dimethylglycine dehydrogenase
MKTHYKAIVIGGGITGAAIIYHLTKMGWSEVALIERRELTAGSTWHAAASNNQLHDITNMARLQTYTINSFEMIEKETGQSCGIHKNGGIYIATTDARADQLLVMAAKAKFLGCTFDPITKEKALEMNPLLDLSDAKALYYTPHENHVDPNGATHAFAKGARNRGADIIRYNAVTGLTQLENGNWKVVTEKGVLTAEHVVNAAGLWAREVGRLAGVELPVHPLEHQYFVTEAIPAVEALVDEIPSVHDNDKEYYLRQEGPGLLFGAYEKNGVHWAVEGTPLDFDTELLPDDLDRIEENYLAACERTPCLETAGVKSVINGPMIWSPDVQPVVGPVPELNNYWVAVGIMAGFSQSAGIGLVLAQWMVDGHPERDLFSIDVARFGPWVDTKYVMEKTAENYSSRFRIYFPYEEREAGRNQRTRPITDIQREQGAVMGAVVGWEYPKYFARNVSEKTPIYSFRRTNWFDAVGEECCALRTSVGLIDISAFSRFRISGEDASTWLDTLVTNTLPTEHGKSVLTPMVDVRGRIQGDFSLTRLEDNDFLLIGSGLAEEYHKRIFKDHHPNLNVSVKSLVNEWAGFNIAGPKSRDVLSTLVSSNVSNNAFAFMTGRWLTVAGLECYVLRVSYTGELGYEVYTKEGDQVRLYRALLQAGEAHNIRLVGGLALNSLRLEKGYGSWGLELTSDYTPYEADLGRFVKLNKGEFVGRDALQSLKNATENRLRLFEIDVDDADPVGGEPVYYEGHIVGEVTSGSFGHVVKKSLALVYVKAELDQLGTDFLVEIIGNKFPARMLPIHPYDPEGLLLRT